VLSCPGDGGETRVVVRMSDRRHRSWSARLCLWKQRGLGGEGDKQGLCMRKGVAIPTCCEMGRPIKPGVSGVQCRGGLSSAPRRGKVFRFPSFFSFFISGCSSSHHHAQPSTSVITGSITRLQCARARTKGSRCSVGGVSARIESK